MKNGIYTRKVIDFFQVVLYEKEGCAEFVIVNNGQYPNLPIVLSGKNAERLILAIADCLDIIEEEAKGS